MGMQTPGAPRQSLFNNTNGNIQMPQGQQMPGLQQMPQQQGIVPPQASNPYLQLMNLITGPQGTQAAWRNNSPNQQPQASQPAAAPTASGLAPGNKPWGAPLGYNGGGGNVPTSYTSDGHMRDPNFYHPPMHGLTPDGKPNWDTSKGYKPN